MGASSVIPSGSKLSVLSKKQAKYFDWKQAHCSSEKQDQCFLSGSKLSF
jgi:hypothetical protein